MFGLNTHGTKLFHNQLPHTKNNIIYCDDNNCHSNKTHARAKEPIKQF